MAGTSNSITTHNVLSGVLNADNVISGLVNTAFNPAYALVTQAGAQIVLFINNNDYKMYAQLKDKSGNLIYTSNIIDLPLETMVVDGRYDSNTKKLILVLDNGNEIEVPLEALINGLVNEDDLIANYYDKDEINALLDGYWTKIELTQEDIDNWNAKQEYLNQGDGIEISADAILKGNTYQESTTGYNLFKTPYNESSTTKNGITFTINEDGSIHVEGTATEKTQFALRNNDKILDLLVGETYTFTASGLGAIDSTVWLDTYGQTGNFLGKWALTSTTPYTSAVAEAKDNKPSISITVENGATVNTNIKVWIYKGSYDAGKGYEPYTNGASPNPDYPQNIQVVSGDNTIKVEGKNLFDKSTIVAGDVINANPTIRLTSRQVLYVEAGTYTISTNLDLSIYKYALQLLETAPPRNNYNNIYDTGWLYVSNKTITLTQSGYIMIGISKQNNGTLTPSDIQEYNFQLEKGSQATTYEAYQSASYPVNLGSLELCKIGNYQDYLYKDNGKWYLNKQIGKVVLDGSENWNYEDQTTRAKFSSNALINNSVATQQNLSNYFRVGSANIGILNVYSNNWIDIFVEPMVLADFKTWLSTHNTIVYYPCTPTITEITDTTLISQLNALTIGFSNNWVENISQTNADLPFEIEYDNKNLTISASSNLVRNTDYASSTTGGVIKTNYSNSFSTNPSNGIVYCDGKTYEQYQSAGNGMFIGKQTLENVITGKALETANNKVTSISSSSTDTQYPSAKCVYDLVGDVETILTTLDVGSGV